MTATTEPGPRIATLDIVRGVAVMGILAMNIVAFSMPMGAYFNPSAYGGSTGLDLFTWTVNFVFVDGKMRGLFSFLFGASMLLVIQRAQTKGEDPRRIHFRRMIWLLLFGLLHLYLVWWGDILSHYALIGMLAYLFRDKPVASLIKWAVALIAVEGVLLVALGGSFLVMSGKAAAPGASAEAVSQWREMKAGFGPLPATRLAEDLALYTGGYFEIMTHRLKDWFSPVTTAFLFGAETLAYMLLGMAALKSGFLTGAWEDRRYRKWALIGYAISIPAFAILAFIDISSGFDTATVVMVGMAGTTPFRPLMIVAHAALIILLTRRGGALVQRIAAAGRAAFTNYLGTSILVTTLFYGYGFGLYGDLGRAEVYLVVLAVWALMLLWSKPWLDRYRYGPFEWLWRTLARGKMQPMRKPLAAA
jgi:uncharacterized protein